MGARAPSTIRIAFVAADPRRSHNYIPTTIVLARCPCLTPTILMLSVSCSVRSLCLLTIPLLVYMVILGPFVAVFTDHFYYNTMSHVQETNKGCRDQLCNTEML